MWSLRVFHVVVVAAASGSGCGGGGDGGGADAPPLPYIFGGDRPVELQVPDSYDPARSYPLVMVLHGYGVTGVVQQAYLGFGDAADTRDVLLVAPEGTVDTAGSQFWNASDDCCDFDGSGVDDVGYLTGLVTDIGAAYAVDPARVFVLGHSNGAYMAYRLACEHPEVIAAIMGLAGAASFADPTRCVPARSVNILHVHGDADDAVPYAGGPGGPGGSSGSPGAVASIERWGGYDGCTGPVTRGAGDLDLDAAVAGADTVIDAVAGCPPGVGVELWTILGGGHIPNFIQPATADRIWGWLAAHPRP
jgi:polyhydroxybutyrate depolymerase